MTLEDYLTAIEAAHRLNVHPETVKRLCRQGDIPAQKFRNTWLIRRDVLDMFSSTYDPHPGAEAQIAIMRFEMAPSSNVPLGIAVESKG